MRKGERSLVVEGRERAIQKKEGRIDNIKNS